MEKKMIFVEKSTLDKLEVGYSRLRYRNYFGAVAKVIPKHVHHLFCQVFDK